MDDALVRQLNPDPLAISLTMADGRIERHGPDEFDPADIPNGYEHSSSIPGGFKAASWDLPRRIEIDWPDLNLLDSFRVYGAGNETVFEGRVVQIPRSHGDGYQIVPGGVGWVSHLQDHKGLVEIYGDADMGQWGEVTPNRRVAFGALPYGSDYNLEGAGNGAIVFNGVDAKAITLGSGVETMYVAPPGVAISKVSYKSIEAFASNEEAATLFGSASDDMSSAASSALTLDDTLRTATLSTAKRYLMLRAIATGTHTALAGQPFRRIHKLVCVYGDHGLTLHPIDASTPDGLLASDVVADILSRWAPLLTYTTGPGGSIETTTLPLPHIAFREPTDAATAIQTVNAPTLSEWGVYDGREFFFRETDPDRCCWEARLSEGAKLELEGDQADDVYNGIIVTYTDYQGQKKIVGPPGADADNTDAALADTDPANPVNAHGIPVKWDRREITAFPTYLAAATAIGVAWLAEQSLPQRRGTITLVGTCQHPTMGDRPVSRIRAGDYIRLQDFPADVPRRILEVSYTHDTRTAVLTCSNEAAKIDAVLERLTVLQTGSS